MDLINPDAPAQKSAKYALREYERRFLLHEIPGGSFERSLRITDNYISGTRLRVRRVVENRDGVSTPTYKLTQKVAAPDGGPGLTTNFYLNEAEYNLLAALPCHRLSKVRYGLPPFVVDVFEAPLDGLVTAEAEFADEKSLQAFEPPSFVVAEVTTDVRFTGGRLAVMTREELLQLLADFALAPRRNQKKPQRW